MLWERINAKPLITIIFMINQRSKKLRRGRSDSVGWQEDDNKNLEGRTKTSIVFSNWIFFVSFFSLCFFCVHYFSFVLLTIFRTTKWQKKHINKESIINKVTTMSWRSDTILNFPKNYLIWSYLVILFTCNIQVTFYFI